MSSSRLSNSTWSFSTRRFATKSFFLHFALHTKILSERDHFLCFLHKLSGKFWCVFPPLLNFFFFFFFYYSSVQSQPGVKKMSHIMLQPSHILNPQIPRFLTNSPAGHFAVWSAHFMSCKNVLIIIFLCSPAGQVCLITVPSLPVCFNITVAFQKYELVLVRILK